MVQGGPLDKSTDKLAIIDLGGQRGLAKGPHPFVITTSKALLKIHFCGTQLNCTFKTRLTLIQDL